jgi:hypothetical protein
LFWGHNTLLNDLGDLNLIKIYKLIRFFLVLSNYATEKSFPTS